MLGFLDEMQLSSLYSMCLGRLMRLAPSETSFAYTLRGLMIDRNLFYALRTKFINLIQDRPYYHKDPEKTKEDGNIVLVKRLMARKLFCWARQLARATHVE